MTTGDTLRLLRRGATWYGTYYLDGRRVRRSTGCRDRDAAEQVVRRWERGGALPGSQASLADALAAVAADCDRRGVTRAAATYRQHAARLVDFYGAARRLCDLDRALAGAYVLARRTAGAADATIAGELRTLRTALRAASEAGQWRGDPAALTPLDDLTLTTRADAVYFVQHGADGPIKIGWARDLDRRLATMQTGNPVDLTLLAWQPGAPADERRLHQRFAAARLKREWFAATPELLAYIARLAATRGEAP